MSRRGSSTMGSRGPDRVDPSPRRSAYWGEWIPEELPEHLHDGPLGAADDPPTDQFWISVPKFVLDQPQQKRTVKFLSKSWTAALNEERKSVEEDAPLIDHLEAFMKAWVSDMLYRQFQALDNIEDVLPAQAAADLFADLCHNECIPRKYTVRMRSQPPLSWPAVPRAVNFVFGELFNSKPFKKAALTTMATSSSSSAPPGSWAERPTINERREAPESAKKVREVWTDPWSPKKEEGYWRQKQSRESASPVMLAPPGKWDSPWKSKAKASGWWDEPSGLRSKWPEDRTSHWKEENSWWSKEDSGGRWGSDRRSRSRSPPGRPQSQDSRARSPLPRSPLPRSPSGPRGGGLRKSSPSPGSSARKVRAKATLLSKESSRQRSSSPPPKKQKKGKKKAKEAETPEHVTGKSGNRQARLLSEESDDGKRILSSQQQAQKVLEDLASELGLFTGLCQAALSDLAPAQGEAPRAEEQLAEKELKATPTASRDEQIGQEPKRARKVEEVPKALVAEAQAAEAPPYCASSEEDKEEDEEDDEAIFAALSTALKRAPPSS